MTLPPEALQAFATNPEWKVSEIIRHIVESGNFYAFQIASALEAKGFVPVDLDELDLWSFESANG